MGDWPSSLGQSQGFASYPAVTVLDPDGKIIANASAHTKGAWTELCPSTPYAGFICFHMASLSAANDVLYDIGIGAAGSEAVIVGNLLFSSGSAANLEGIYSAIPIEIPAGTRIAVRCQAETGSSYSYGFIDIIGSGGFGHDNGLSVCDTYGANEADSGGTSIDPGATANTKGAWVELSASTTRAIKALMLAAGGNADRARPYAWWAVDIGIGAEGSERVIVSDYHINSITSTDTVRPTCSPIIPVSIPAGSRLCVRASCNINTAGDRLFDAVVYTFS